MDTASRLRAMDKKARRQANHRARKAGNTLERGINDLATQLRAVPQDYIAGQMNKLYERAKRDMDKRVKLGEAGRNGDVQAAKARRKLNDWQLGKEDRSTKDAWFPEQVRQAKGKCSIAGVNMKAKLKSQGAEFTR